MAARRSYHHGNLVEALVQASIAIIESEGLESLTLRKAARLAGVSHAAPAHHFDDLEGLLAAVAERGYQRLLDRMQAGAGASTPALERLRAVGLGYVRFAASEPGLFRTMFHPRLADKTRHPSLMEATQRTLCYLADAVRACQEIGAVREGDPVRLGRFAWATVHGASMLLVDRQLSPSMRPDDVERIATEVTLDLFFGLRRG